MSIFNNISESDKKASIENLISCSTPRPEFFLMTMLSILMATFGLLLDNGAIIIGSMLIAPMLYPILSLSMGIVMSDFKLISLSFYTLLKSIIFGVTASALVTLFFVSRDFEMTSEILTRAQPSIIYAAVAIIAGLAASFAMVKPNLSETLPGIAISVALIPPLAVTGIGIAFGNWEIISNSFILLLINIGGIIFSSMVIFSLMNLYIKRQVAQDTVKNEEHKMELENKK